MGPVAEAWVPSGHDHRGACRAISSDRAKSGQKFPSRGKVQIPDYCTFNAHSHGSGSSCIGWIRDEQCRTAMVGTIGAAPKQTLKLDPLLSITCNIKPELAVADDDRAAGQRPPIRK
jgi:hypothetical protein